MHEKARLINNKTHLLILTSLLGIVFLAGSFAQKHCVFPFCQGYLVNARSLLATAVIEEGAGRDSGPDTLSTSLYEITVQTVSLEAVEVSAAGQGQSRLLGTEGRDGGISAMGNDLLVASRQGDLLHLDEHLHPRVLPTKVPTPLERFEASLSGTEYEEETADSRALREDWFGVKDLLLIEDSPDHFTIFASYNNWKPDEQCYTLKVSQIELTRTDETIAPEGSWLDVYETEPCLELKDQSHPFAGHESGGRLARLSDTELLLSVGDFEHDGYWGPNLPQDRASHYGKTIRMDLESGSADIYSVGHRNPQGLHIDEAGHIWLTEHGPRGGDELNLIEEGNNYGWPHVSYGTMYEQYTWPPSEQDGSHEGYTQPVFSWTPSIAPSQLISITGDRFDLWHGDLMIASLAGRALHRTRIREGRAVLMERIGLDWRIRDLVERDDGALVLKTDQNTLLVLEPTEAN